MTLEAHVDEPGDGAKRDNDEEAEGGDEVEQEEEGEDD
jgi:hypothetical protein